MDIKGIVEDSSAEYTREGSIVWPGRDIASHTTFQDRSSLYKVAKTMAGSIDVPDTSIRGGR